MPVLALVSLVFGIGLLTLGADALVRGSAGLAERFGLSPLVIGLTIVAFGTSMPEIAVSVGSAVIGDGGVALGNAVGSNIFNVLVVLGGAAVLQPLAVDRHLVRLDLPIMIFTAVLVLALSLDGTLGRGDGALLVTVGVLYTLVLLRLAKEEDPLARGARALRASQHVAADAGGDPARDAPGTTAPPHRSVARQVAGIAFGLMMLAAGARYLVTGAETVARAVGASELVIGLTVVAAGTSLPELATSFIAAARGQRDIAIGNVVGSNIFNALFVLGAAGMVERGGVPVPVGVRTFDLPVMIAVSAACLPIFFTGWSISRREGWLFLGYYGAYLLYLALSHAQHDAQDLVGTALLFFALPLTGLTLTAVAVRQLRASRSSAVP